MRKEKILLFCTQMKQGGAQKVLLYLYNYFKKSPRFEPYLAAFYCEKNFYQAIDLGYQPTKNLFISFFSFIFALCQLFQLIKKKKINQVLCFGIYANIVVPIIAKIAGAKKIYTSQRATLRYKSNFIHWLEKIIVNSRIVSKTIFNSINVRNFYLRHYGFRQKKCQVIYNGIELPSLTKSKKTNKIGVVASLHSHKGHQYLIKAMPEIITKFPQNKFIFAGDGPEKNHLKQLAQKLKVEDYIQFVGNQPREEIFPKVDFTILPSLDEGMPNAILESLAFEKPVIGTNIDGISEIIEDGQDGILVPVKNSRKLTEAIINLLKNHKKQNIMGKIGRQKITKLFSMEKFYHGYEQLFTDQIQLEVKEKPSITRKINFAGIKVDFLTLEGLLYAIFQIIQTGQKQKIIFTLNGEGLYLNKENKDFARYMSVADIIHADGMSIVFFSRLFGKRLPERLATTDIIHPISAFAAQQGYTFYFLGGQEKISQKAARILMKKYPGLKVVGSHHGFFQPEENKKIIDEINQKKPDILWVGFGRPLQEKWVYENRHQLNVPIIKTCGGVFDFVSGKTPQAPVWMANLGLEWFFRFLSNPKRLWKRAWIGNIKIAYYVFRWLLFHR